LACVARYTHRVAISNDRLIAIGDGKVPFRWKDYRHGNQHNGADFQRGPAASFSTSSPRASSRPGVFRKNGVSAA
jgi:hypothetical protein